jgi:hypothetical protein
MPLTIPIQYRDRPWARHLAMDRQYFPKKVVERNHCIRWTPELLLKGR